MSARPRLLGGRRQAAGWGRREEAGPVPALSSEPAWPGPWYPGHAPPDTCTAQSMPDPGSRCRPNTHWGAQRRPRVWEGTGSPLSILEPPLAPPGRDEEEAQRGAGARGACPASLLRGQMASHLRSLLLAAWQVWCLLGAGRASWSHVLPGRPHRAGGLGGCSSERGTGGPPTPATLAPSMALPLTP